MVKNVALHILNTLLGFLLMSYPISSLGQESDSTALRMIKVDMRNGLPESRIRALCTLQDGRIAIATAGYLSIYDGISFTNYPIVSNNGILLSSERKNRQLFQDKNGVIWLKTPVTEQQDQVRLLAFDAKTGKEITAGFKKNLEGEKIKDFYIDNQGSPFFIDNSNNLFKHSQYTSQKIFCLTSISKELPASILTLEQETYICYDDGKIATLDLKDGIVKHIGYPDLPYKDLRLINSFAKYENGKIWLPFHQNHDKAHTWFASFDIRSKKWEYSHIPSLAYDFIVGKNDSIIVSFPNIDDSIFCIDTTPTGEIWVGTQSSGLYYINENDKAISNYINKPEPMHEGKLFENERCRRLAERYAPGIVNGSAVDTLTNYVYLATRQGLMIIDDKDNLLKVLDRNIGLPQINVQSIVANVVNASQSEHHTGDIWFTTSSILSRLRFLSSDTLEIIHLGLLDGIDISGKEFITRSLGVDSTGMLLAGYPNGYYAINPLRIDETVRTRHLITLKNDGIIERSGSLFKWIFLFLAIVVLIACVVYLQSKRRKIIIQDYSCPSSIPDSNEPVNIEDPCNDSPIVTLCDSLVTKVKETVKTEKNESQNDAIEFKEKLNKIINQHLDDQSLNVVSLSSMMAMDRTNLYRKMQSVLGTSPSTYIKEARLSAAARLLKETDIPIADIALKTGFSSTKYFSSTFKEKYGDLPSKFRSS